MPVMPRVKWESAEQHIEYLRHLAAYTIFARDYITDKEVLEIGCGSGYGSKELSYSASRIVAIDICEDSISYCRDEYGNDNLLFMTANGLRLPYKDGSFDVLLSFQVIEHIEPKMVMYYLSDIKRVLRSGGIFLVSTPNSRLRLLPVQKPWNPEHKKEYTDRELKNLLSKVFEQVKVCGLCASSDILSIERNRVKQSLLKVYMLNTFHQALNLFLPKPIIHQIRRVKQNLYNSTKSGELVPQATFTCNLSLSDLRVAPDCPKDCLDLYAICTKAET